MRYERPRLCRASKVPLVTLGFWIIKILATTLGETGGDTVTMTMKLQQVPYGQSPIFLSAIRRYW